MLRNVFEKEVEIYKRKKKWKFLKYNDEVSLPGQEVNSKQILVIRVYSVARREKPVLPVCVLHRLSQALLPSFDHFYPPLLLFFQHLLLYYNAIVTHSSNRIL